MNILSNSAYRWAEYIYNNRLLPHRPTEEQVTSVLNEVAATPTHRRIIADDDWLADFYYCMEEDFNFAMPY